MTNLYKDPWEDFAKVYGGYTPPVVPAKRDMEIIESYLKKILKINKHPNILILGCTPQYRKLLAKYKLPITLVDAMPAMLKTFDKQLKKYHPKEKKIIANWLTMHLPTKYDLILGDFVIHNLPIRKYKSFYIAVKRHLKKEGLFITRIYHQPIKKRKINEVLKRYKGKKVYHEAPTELMWDFTWEVTFNKRTQKGKNLGAFNALKKAQKKHPWLKPFVDEYARTLPTWRKEWTILTRKGYEKSFGCNFNTLIIKYPKGYYMSELCPTYILKK